MSELTKNDLIKARKLCNIFRFIDDLNSINDYGGNGKVVILISEELQLGKESTDKHEVSFYDLTLLSLGYFRPV